MLIKHSWGMCLCIISIFFCSLYIHIPSTYNNSKFLTCGIDFTFYPENFATKAPRRVLPARKMSGGRIRHEEVMIIKKLENVWENEFLNVIIFLLFLKILYYHSFVTSRPCHSCLSSVYMLTTDRYRQSRPTFIVLRWAGRRAGVT